VIVDQGLPGRLARDRDRYFPELVAQYSAPLYAGALRFTANREDAQDIAQEAFVRAYEALGCYDRQRVAALDLRAWLWTIMANLCRNHARRSSRRPVAVLGDDPPARTPEPSARPAIDGALADLPSSQRLAVVLRHVGGLSVAEIAGVLRRPEGTVKSDIHRGLAAMRRALDEEAHA
jgi:RNA polymerase sigma factor (sigma-70 family)